MAEDAERASEQQLAFDNEGLLTSDEVRTGFISGRTFVNKAVQYSVVDDRAMFEGCICLGTVEEMDRAMGVVQARAADVGIAHGVVIAGEQYRWPNALMPYVFDAGLPAATRQRMKDAIAHWESNSSLRFVERTAANQAQYPNYVHIFRGDGCWSYVGMRGGRQDLSIADGCGFGAAVHELGHAWGLWHEQSREDRDAFVTINWGNIQSGMEHNFNQHIADGDDVGSYDHASIMHYDMFAFSKNGLPTIVPKQPGVLIGQRNGLSLGDVAAVHQIYRATHHNLTILQVYATPHSRNAWVSFSGLGWRKIQADTAEGVTNTLEVLAVSKAYSRKVHAQLDGDHVYEVYGI